MVRPPYDVPPRQRYALIDYKALIDLLSIGNIHDLKDSRKNWVEGFLKNQSPIRESKWTESIAIGSRSFVEKTKELLGIRARGRSVIESNEVYELRESRAPYGNDFNIENSHLRAQNTYYWDVYP